MYWPQLLPLALFITSCILMVIAGRPLIDWLRTREWRKDKETWTVREDTPDTHVVKRGTPSMGGLGIIGSAIVTCIAFGILVLVVQYVNEPTAFVKNWTFSTLYRPVYRWIRLTSIIGLLPLTVIAHMFLGFADDWSKATGRGGLRARAKFGLQVMLSAIVVIIWFLFFLNLPISFDPSAGWSTISYAGRVLGEWWDYIPLMVIPIVVVATCNAVNLTDGIDGLAAGLAVQAGAAFLLVGTEIFHVSYINTLFWSALAGSCLGFLWYNKHPARVFMGDTGSLAIGAALGLGACVSKAVFLLPFIGFIYFVEMFSVIAQVLWFKWTRKRTGEGKRLFRRAPLHHHFELSGWSEWRVVLRFWGVNLITTIIGLILWHTGVLPRWP